MNFRFFPLISVLKYLFSILSGLFQKMFFDIVQSHSIWIFRNFYPIDMFFNSIHCYLHFGFYLDYIIFCRTIFIEFFLLCHLIADFRFLYLLDLIKHLDSFFPRYFLPFPFKRTTARTWTGAGANNAICSSKILVWDIINSSFVGLLNGWIGGLWFCNIIGLSFYKSFVSFGQTIDPS